MVLEVDVDGVPLYGSAAILDHSFAQAVYVDDGSRGKNVPVGRDRDALFGDGSACRVDDSVRAVQRPGTTALFARTVRGRFVFDPFRFFRFRFRGGRLYGHGGDCRRLIINFRVPDDSPALHEMLQSCLQPFGAEVPIYRFTGETRAQAFSHLNAIFTLGKQPMTPLTQQFIHCHFLQFLATVAQHAGESSYEPQELSDSITQKVYAVTSYIHRHYASELSLEYLAEKFFISPYYLSHQFRRVTGFSLINYIQITRVRNAQQLLLYTDMKIADITTSCGFTSFSQFNRVFNKFCHTSPSQFRVNGVVTPITAIPYEKEPSPGSTKV